MAGESGRYYVLFLLLLVYIHCLLCRMLPAFLVSVPTPGCEALCTGVATEPLCQRSGGWESPGAVPDESFYKCQDCRAGEDGNWYNMRDGACIGKSEYGFLVGYGFALPFVLGSFVTMQVVDSMERRTCLAIALCGWSLASGMMSLVSSFWPLLFCRCCLGATEAFVIPAALSMLAQKFDESSRASAASLLAAGVCLGAGTASWGVTLAMRIGWRSTCACVGLLGVILAGLVFTTIQEPERLKVAESPSAAKKVSMVRSPVVWILTAAASLRLAASYTIAAFLPVYYLRAQLPGYTVDGYATSNAIIVASAGLMSGLCGGALADVLGQRAGWESAPAQIAGWATVVAAVFYVGVFSASTFAGSIGCYAVALLLGECWYGLTLVQVQDVVSDREKGQTTTMLLSVATIISNASPAAVGYVDPGTKLIGSVMLKLIVGCLFITALLFAIASSSIQGMEKVDCLIDRRETFKLKRVSLVEDALDAVKHRASRRTTFFGPSEIFIPEDYDICDDPEDDSAGESVSG